MKLKLYSIIVVSQLFITQMAFAQEQTETSYLSGSLQANGNFFIRDSAIGAANTPQYDRQLFGAETWLSLKYQRAGYDMGLRFDMFNNSNLLNPQGSFTGQGIGRWYVRKKMDDFNIGVGYLYDQIGSGIIFRAYEERPLLIDNALYGVNLSYHLNPDWKIKAFTGRQKQQFDIYNGIIKGANIEGFASDSAGTWSCAPGFGIVNRTLDDETVQKVVSTIGTYTLPDSIGAKYNTYLFSLYNKLTVGNFTWYIEGAYKTNEVFFDPFAEKINRNGSISLGKLVNRAGHVFYTTLGYTQSGLGITLEAKRTENFTFRTNPFVTLNRGIIHFLPPMARQNTYRLTARYNAATQEIGEQALQLDVKAALSDKWQLDANLSGIDDLKNNLLYRELNINALRKFEQDLMTVGIQFQTYNQSIYEVKPNVPNVQTITPYIEYNYHINDEKTLRMEAQYMHTKQDYGSWLFLLGEYSIAPKWVLTVSDMYNVLPKKTSALHYPTLAAAYTQGATRFSLAYVKQVEGVVCTGGICRLEPAFSGIRFNVNTTF
ncbi:MAG: hypothetical protein RL329_4224 [Bacteroidota bacterium]